MRNAFIEELVTLATENDRIALIVGDLGYSVVEPFAEKFPERFINAGVAEQNMMGLAAGMASEGYQVFVYSIANFPTFRCAACWVRTRLRKVPQGPFSARLPARKSRPCRRCIRTSR